MCTSIITEDEKEVYQYGTEQIIINFTTFLVISIIAYYLEVWIPTLFWLLGILPIRAVAGGFHASSPMKCNLLTLSIYLINIAVTSLLPRYMTFYILIVALCVIMFCIFKFAPVDHKNMVLECQEYLIAKRKSRMIGIVISVACLSAATIVGADHVLIVSLVVGALTASISRVTSPIR